MLSHNHIKKSPAYLSELPLYGANKIW